MLLLFNKWILRFAFRLQINIFFLVYFDFYIYFLISIRTQETSRIRNQSCLNIRFQYITIWIKSFFVDYCFIKQYMKKSTIKSMFVVNRKNYNEYYTLLVVENSLSRFFFFWQTDYSKFSLELLNGQRKRISKTNKILATINTCEPKWCNSKIL